MQAEIMRKNSKRLPLIGLTMGDAAGIGPEITLKALQKKSITSRCYPFIIGDAHHLNLLLKKFSLSGEIHLISKIEDYHSSPNLINVLALNNLPKGKIKFGVGQPSYGKAAFAHIKKGVELALSKKIDALVTAPINKQVLHQAGIHFPGHTEILAQLSRTKRFAMMLVGGNLRVVLVTRHIPFKKVPEEINKEQLATVIDLTQQAGKYFALPHPQVGVCALNPHAGEGGVMGEEESKIISPVIKQAQKKGIKISGPYPSDTLFYEAIKGKFDFIIAMYHDQGLIPLKTLFFEEGVNVTLGLPFIRTSPDHGTAYDIAGKGVANSKSIEEALKLALRMTKTSP